LLFIWYMTGTFLLVTLESGTEFCKMLNLLPYLLHHCYGGSYVAASSKSYGVTELLYLFALLNYSIVSVQHSLVPENPFLRPTNEVLYTHTHIINNAVQLGWTGEKIFMIAYSASDSVILKIDAGGRVIAVDFHNLPYGFLNFTLISPERGEGAK
ncbi:Uncharacterized protein BM_BM2790, partial [Brugia malayi]